MRKLARVSIAHLPTPLELMSRLAAELGGPELWIKRDDQTGLATGGNKTRKLELLLYEALEQDARVVLTVGAPQSNHCRQTAAAATRAGLECVLVLGGFPQPREIWNGNLLLDDLFGARIHWAGDRDPLGALAEAAECEREAGRAPYTIPYGGSNSLGAAAYAYAYAFAELWQQSQERGINFDRILLATSSGGTQAGLIVGAKACGYAGQILGISVDKTGGQLRPAIHRLLAPTAERLALTLAFEPGDVVVDDRYVGSGYGVLTAAERHAMHQVARCEGILLDPVYTAKAMAGLIDLVRRGELESGEKVLFWHTGGIPAIFAYSTDLLS